MAKKSAVEKDGSKKARAKAATKKEAAKKLEQKISEVLKSPDHRWILKK